MNQSHQPARVHSHLITREPRQRLWLQAAGNVSGLPPGDLPGLRQLRNSKEVAATLSRPPPITDNRRRFNKRFPTFTSHSRNSPRSRHWTIPSALTTLVISLLKATTRTNLRLRSIHSLHRRRITGQAIRRDDLSMRPLMPRARAFAAGLCVMSSQSALCPQASEGWGSRTTEAA